MGCGATLQGGRVEERYIVSSSSHPTKSPEEPTPSTSSRSLLAARGLPARTVEVDPASVSTRDESESEGSEAGHIAFGHIASLSSEKYTEEWAAENSPMQLPPWLERRLSIGSRRSDGDTSSSALTDISPLSSTCGSRAQSPSRPPSFERPSVTQGVTPCATPKVNTPSRASLKATGWGLTPSESRTLDGISHKVGNGPGTPKRERIYSDKAGNCPGTPKLIHAKSTGSLCDGKIPQEMNRKESFRSPDSASGFDTGTTPKKQIAAPRILSISVESRARTFSD